MVHWFGLLAVKDPVNNVIAFKGSLARQQVVGDVFPGQFRSHHDEELGSSIIADIGDGVLHVFVHVTRAFLCSITLNI